MYVYLHICIYIIIHYNIQYIYIYDMHYFYMYAKDPPTIPVVCRRVSLTNPFSKTMPDPEDSGVGGCSAPGEEDDELF